MFNVVFRRSDSYLKRGISELRAAAILQPRALQLRSASVLGGRLVLNRRLKRLAKTIRIVEWQSADDVPKSKSIVPYRPANRTRKRTFRRGRAKAMRKMTCARLACPISFRMREAHRIHKEIAKSHNAPSVKMHRIRRIRAHECNGII